MHSCFTYVGIFYCAATASKAPLAKSPAPATCPKAPALSPVAVVKPNVGMMRVPMGTGAGADKTMPKQIKAKQKITTGFIWKARMKFLKITFWVGISTYDAVRIGSDDKSYAPFPFLYILAIGAKATKMMQNRILSGQHKTEREETKDWKLAWNAWLNMKLWFCAKPP